MNNQQIDDLFTYHNPQDIDPNRFTVIREFAKRLAYSILENGGNSKDIERSINALRQCVFYAIASIVLPEDI